MTSAAQFTDLDPALQASLAEARGIAIAIDRSQAVISFDLSGNVLSANANFLEAMGYRVDEVVGRHHRMFCDPEYAGTQEYADLWKRLGEGEFESGIFKRVAKDGRPVWIQATYNPILDADGVPERIVKVASDITQAALRNAEQVGKVAAIDRSQAVIEFAVDGTILAANENFLRTTGHVLEEVAGKHHRIFCEPEFATSDEYADFWKRLGAGEFESGVFERRAKDGRPIWLRATYNPILDADGSVLKIVKFASDITRRTLENAEFRGKVAAIDRAQAVIEFDLTGTVLTANDNFLQATGYSRDEVVGKHHRIFCEPEYAATQEYADFWERLGRGEYVTGEFRRVAKDGADIWLQATYNPILDAAGRPVKIVKFATAITADKIAAAEVEGKLDAVQRAQAVIEFDLDGHVLAANENFLRAIGYSLREIAGQHHSMFCSEEYVVSEEYRDFWLRLGKGELISGRFARVGKFGRAVHIQASYNPIFDLDGNVMKVVKYAYDITAQVERDALIASHTREMTASAADLARSIEEIAASSGVAMELAQETGVNADQGSEALRASLEAIALIQRSSASIGEIVRVMSEIANQTNLLAFNASIEAARAGEHGVGFSIVAGEVRKLAERSSEAAQQISKLIDESAERVTQGSEVSKRAGEAFEQIVGSVARTNEVIARISSATREQQEASQAVSELITRIAETDVPA